MPTAMDKMLAEIEKISKLYDEKQMTSQQVVEKIFSISGYKSFEELQKAVKSPLPPSIEKLLRNIEEIQKRPPTTDFRS